LHLVEKGYHHTRADECCDQADYHPLERQPEAAPDDQTEDRGGRGTDGDADADLACPLADEICKHAVDADRRQRERQRRKQPEQPAGETRRGPCTVDDVGHRANRRDRKRWIHRGDLVVNRADEGHRIARRFHHERHVADGKSR
jgi:hypothetical protein